MNIRDLTYLKAIAEHKNFSKAAQACFISQPTLSAQLKKLENELGVQLFEKQGKQSLLTPLGKQIAEQATYVLREVEQLKAIAQLSKDPYAGNLRLGIIPTLGPYLLPRVLPLIKKQLSKLKIILHENKTTHILADLKKGELDAIILALPVPDEGLTTKVLFIEPFYVALPKNHFLGKKSAVAISELKNETLLLLEEGHCLRDQILDVCTAENISEATDFHATSLETLVQLVANNSGITLLPALARQKNPRIMIKSFRKPQPSRTIAMLWRTHSPKHASCEIIADTILHHFKII